MEDDEKEILCSHCSLYICLWVKSCRGLGYTHGLSSSGHLVTPLFLSLLWLPNVAQHNLKKLESMMLTVSFLS